MPHNSQCWFNSVTRLSTLTESICLAHEQPGRLIKAVLAAQLTASSVSEMESCTRALFLKFGIFCQALEDFET